MEQVPTHDAALEAALKCLHDHGLTVNWDKFEFNANTIKFFDLVFSPKGVSPDPEKVDTIRNTPPRTAQDTQFPRNDQLQVAFHTELCHNHRAIETTHQKRDTVGLVSRTTGRLKYAQEHPVRGREHCKLRHPQRHWSRGGYQPRWPRGHTDTGRTRHSLRDPCLDSRRIPIQPNRTRGPCHCMGVWTLWHVRSWNTTLCSYHWSQTPREYLAEATPAATHREVGSPTTTLQTHSQVQSQTSCLSSHPLANSKNASREQKIAEQYVNFVTTTSVSRAIINDIQVATSRNPTLMMKAISTLYAQVAGSRSKRSLTMLSTWTNFVSTATARINLHVMLITSCCETTRSWFWNHYVTLQFLSRTKVTKAWHEQKPWYTQRSGFNEKGINEKVKQTIHKCLACQDIYSKPGPFEPLRMSDLPPGAWQNLSMDFCGPLPTGEYLMVVMDEYSRYPTVEIVKSVSANTVIPVLDKVLSTFGCCKIIKTDNGSPFNSHAFAKFAEYSGFKHYHITPHWPQANAQAEEFNKPQMKLVRTARLEHKSWRQELHKYLRQYRATHQLMSGREPRTRLTQIDLNRPSASDRQARANDEQAKFKQKQYADIRLNARHNDIAVWSPPLRMATTSLETPPVSRASLRTPTAVSPTTLRMKRRKTTHHPAPKPHLIPQTNWPSNANTHLTNTHSQNQVDWSKNKL